MRLSTSACEAAVPIFLFLGGLTADVSRFSVYLSLHASDVLLVGAGLLALPLDRTRIPRASLSFLRENREFLYVAVLGALYLLGIGTSTLIAGVPRAGVETWLLFSLFFVLLVPLTAVAIARHEHGMRALALGLVCGALGAAFGLLDQAREAGDAFFYGPRPAGVLGSDPFFLMIVGVAIVFAHIVFSVVRSPLLVPWLRRRFRRPFGFGVILVEAICLCVLIAAILISRYRAGWIGAAAVYVLVVVVVARRLRAAILAVAAAGIVGVGAVLLGVLPGPLVDRITESFSTSQPDLGARREATSRLLEVWAERPWGVGLNQSGEYVPERLAEGGNESIHNIVAHSLVEGGPLAALAIALLPVALSAVWIRNRPRGTSVTHWTWAWPIAAVWALFIAGQFSPSLYPHAVWISVGALLGCAARRVTEPDAPT